MIQADAPRTAQLLRLLVLPVCISLMVFVAASLYAIFVHENSPFALQELARVTFLVTSFAAALVIFPIGVVGTLFWAVRMSGELVPGPKPLWVRFNHLNAVFAPHYLTSAGLDHRRKLITSYAIALVGAVHGIVAIFLNGLSSSAT